MKKTVILSIVFILIMSISAFALQSDALKIRQAEIESEIIENEIKELTKEIHKRCGDNEDNVHKEHIYGSEYQYVGCSGKLIHYVSQCKYCTNLSHIYKSCLNHNCHQNEITID